MEVYSITATDWAEDPTGTGFDTVTFSLCLDPRGVITFGADGEELTDAHVDHMYQVSIEVIGQPDSELGWSFIEYNLNPDGEC